VILLSAYSLSAFIGTGMLAIPVLAGSALLWRAEASRMAPTLESKAPEAVGGSILRLSQPPTVIGFGLGFSEIDPQFT